MGKLLKGGMMENYERCDVCEKYKATRKDYRYIDGLFNGKIFNCEWCNPLSDVALYQIAVEKREPKSFYDDDEEEA